MLPGGMEFGLGTLPLVTQARTRSINAENPRGEVGFGGQAASNLGPGRKGRPCIDLKKGEAVTLAEIEGPGTIQHIWITVTDKTEKYPFVLRNLVLRMYWDGEEAPSVEAPLGDFFCNGFGERVLVNSLPISVNHMGGMNCYFPMPFRKSARIVIDNQHAEDIGGFFFQITYSLVEELPENIAYFHARWNRTYQVEKAQDHVILDEVKGAGQYVGTYVALSSLERSWWGEGEVKFYMDGDEAWPTICGTGTEDYFGGAWCFADLKEGRPGNYGTPFLGYHYHESTAKADAWYGHTPAAHGLYRWHVMDPIRFSSALKVTLQDIGHNGRELYERNDDISSVAYWYQTEPHAAYPGLDDAGARRPR